MFEEIRRPLWWGLRQQRSGKCRSQRCNGEPDHVCLVGHQKDFVFLSEWDQESLEEWCYLTYFERTSLAIALKGNQRAQRLEMRRPTIERMVSWTREGALEMLRMAGVWVNLNGRINGTFSWIGYGWERGVKNDSEISGLQLKEWNCHFLRWGRLQVREVWRERSGAQFWSGWVWDSY